MKKVKKVIQILIFLFYLIQWCQNLQFDEIFSPSPFHTTSLKKIENTMQQLVISDQAGLLFLAIGEEGLIIMDQKTFEIIAEIKDKGEINLFSVTTDGQYLFFPYQNKISIFLLRSKPQYSLELLSQDSSERGQYVTQLQLFNDDKWAAGASLSYLIIYDISNKSKMTAIGELDVGMNPFYVINQLTQYLFLANLELKIVKFKLNSQQVLELSIVLKIPADYAYSSLVITKDQRFIYALDSWGGLYFGKFINLDGINEGTIVEDFTFDVKNWWPTNQSPLPNEIKVTNDEKFIMIGVQQLGIYVFDISNREADLYPKLFQWIRSTGYSFSIRLSKDEKYLYYVNGIQLKIYQRVKPNLNNQYPNLFNLQQANFTVVGTNIYRWRCYITKNDQYFIGSFDKDGLFIFDLKGNPNNMKQLQQVKPDNIYFTESAIIDEDSGYIITPGDSTGVLLFVYQFNQIRQSQKLQPITQVDSNDPNIVMEGIRYSKNKNYIGIAAYSSVILIDSSNGPLQLKTISSITFNNEIVELIFSKDDKYILGASRNYGFVCIQIGSDLKLKQVNYLKTSGGFSIIQSLDWNYAFVSEGAKGIGIIDLNQLPNIKFISRVLVEGTTMHILPIQQDQFFLVSSNVEGFITLIDARDKYNLSVISKYLASGQNGLSSCVNSSQEFIMLTNSFGVTSLPISSKVQVHTEIFLVLGRETKKIVYQRQQPDQILLIGQSFQFQFYQIYPLNGAKLTNIYYYYNFQIVSLPYWINFNQQISAANLEAVKDALGDDVTVPEYNTIVLEFKLPLTSSSFLFDPPTDDGVVITQELSQKIYKQLRQMEILNYENFLITNNFDRSEEFRFSDNSMNDNQPLLDKVKLILQQSIYQNPIMFKVANSLRFFSIPQAVPEYAQQNADQIIQKYFVFSIQNSIEMYLEVQRGVGKFVDIYYDGVIAQISNFETHLKLEGNLKNINNVLQNRILFFKQDLNLHNDEIVFSIRLNDGVNYSIETKVKLSEASLFINLKKPVLLNLNKSLQKQFNQMYSGGSVAIQDNLSFEFSKETFINEDTQILHYKASFKMGDQYADQVSGAWIQQSSNSLRFFGIIPIEEFRTILNIKIEATDGYTTASDTFNLYVYSIPFVYILSTLAKIFGPILTVLGLYRYRSYFFNFAFHKKNAYKKESVEVFTNYYKKITIMSDENIKAMLFFKAFLKQIHTGKDYKKRNNVSIQIESNTKLGSKSPEIGPYQNQKPMTTINRLDDKNNDFMFSSIFDENDDTNQQTDHKNSNQNFDSFLKQSFWQDSKIKNILDSLIQNLINYQNDLTKIPSKMQIVKDEENKISKDKLKQNASQTQNNINLNPNQKAQTNSLKNYLRQILMNEQGQIQMKLIIKLMIDKQISIKHRNSIISVKSVIPELVDSGSLLYQSLKALVSRYLLKQEPVLLSIYQFLKHSAKLEAKMTTKTTIDWYLKYIKTIAEENENEFKLLSFPKIQLLIDQIKLQAKLMVLLLQNNPKFLISQLITLKKGNFPYKLLYNVLVADSLGLIDKAPSIFQPSVGESIHQNFFEIHSVQAFKKVDMLQCSLFRRFLKLDVMNYGSSKNQQLPSWMKFTLKSNAIVLSGTPKLQDVETFIIRIYDVSDYIIRQFEVEIFKPPESSPQNMKELNEMQDEDMQDDGIISPTDTLQLSERRNEVQINNSINQDSFFSSNEINNEQIQSPSSRKHFAINSDTARQFGAAPITLKEQEDYPFVQTIIKSEYQIKKK